VDFKFVHLISYVYYYYHCYCYCCGGGGGGGGGGFNGVFDEVILQGCIHEFIRKNSQRK